MLPGAFVVHKVIYVCLAIAAAFLAMEVSRKRGLQVAIAVACFLFIGFIFSLGLADDSYISLRFARNFAAGHGLVFNVGERVEGYTCFLWVLLIGLAKRAVPALDLVRFAKVLGVAFGVASLLVIYRFSSFLAGQADTGSAEPGETPPPTRGAAAFASAGFAFFLMLVATDFPFVYWSFSGMETSFYVAIMVGSAYCFTMYLAVGPRRLVHLGWSSLLLAAAVLTRPETGIVPFLNLAFVLALERQNMKRALAIMAVPLLAVLAPYLAWRYHYYGHLLPNTYYAKVRGGSLALSLFGIKYLARGAIPHAILVAFVVAKIARLRRRLRRLDAYVLGQLGLWVIAIVYTGADHFIELRYFVYMLPFMYLFAFDEIAGVAWRMSQGLSHIARGRSLPQAGRALIGIFAVVSFLAVFYYNSLGITATVLCGKHLGDKWGRLGRWLEENSRPADVIATPVVGAIGYYCDRTIVDMVGIVDPVIAHSTRGKPGEGPKDHGLFDTEYVLGRRPKYIYLLSSAPTEQAFLKRPDPIPAIQDLKRFFPNPGYEFGVVQIAGDRFALYRAR
jgi:arabinofuranosyltransferase